MKKIFILLLFLEIISYNYEICSQVKFSAKSDLIKLNIKPLPPDTIPPFFTINLPNVKEGFAINFRDSIFFINGLVSDNLGKTKLFVNNELKGSFTNGQFSTSHKLEEGENVINISVLDKKNNKTEKTIKINYDKRADINPPQIKLLPPFEQLNRGIQVISKSSLFEDIILSGNFFDESEILEIKVNGLDVDSMVNGNFYFNFKKSLPDTIILTAADIYGNYTEIIAKVKFEDPAEIQNTLKNITYHALLIGVEDYADQRINNLDNPLKDVENLKRVLIDNYTFEKQNVVVLKNPKRISILTALQKFREKLAENDNLLIFFAGHGYYDQDQDMGYWLPSDAVKDDYSNWLPNSTVRDFIRAINTKHTLLISDACFAGSIFSSREPILNASRSILEIYKVRSRKAMTSGIKNQKVQDRSKFSEYFIKFLLENNSKFLTTQELFTKIRSAVLNNTQVKQNPEFGSIPFTGDEGLSGDFIFIHK